MKTKTQKTKEKILDNLGDKTTAERLAEEYVEAENELLKELGKLENGGCDCNCSNVSIIEVVSSGEFSEVVTYCLNCGGCRDGI